ncbi:LamG-like jellyroll fold domain-containing protein [Phytohabitans aurantiacus]|jgi:hypothetical protein|uniref:Laminin G domain-containing protein n=1 Tax=Phytohabitans aurantiacus TaxID=3016789 RepID=A0ABQ5QKE6_9ACTN|nr:LamG-like jellyroll fold domain-containing protein [Phytohabitans aurantiacus]GLH95081.1 hypothetical protein Pa4123_03530 [Phytohabitans aurantiacus]
MSPKLHVALLALVSIGLAGLARPAHSGPPSFSVRYTFDGWYSGSVLDTAGRYPIYVRGAMAFAPRDGGWAARYPARCDNPECPRAILESGPVEQFNPGTRSMRYGASVLMTAADTGDGANVVQKGYSTGGVTQLKLQVDGAAGQPSCVVASKTKIYRVIAPVTVADGRWHALACARTSTNLSISVDGAPRGRVPVPADVSIVNSEPLRIGGKNLSPNNDQYAGLLDDVFLVID